MLSLMWAYSFNRHTATSLQLTTLPNAMQPLQPPEASLVASSSSDINDSTLPLQSNFTLPLSTATSSMVVQLLCLRRLLGLSRRSMTTPLFTETGIMPIRARRVILALRYLIYLINLPRNHYASLALHENHNMRASGIPCWLSDLDWVIQHLPGCSLSLPPLPIISEESILALIKSITAETNSRLQTEIDYSNRLALLQHRLEPQKTGPNKLITRTLRHYLTHVYKSHHRLSLTRLLCGDMVPITFHSSPARIHSLNLDENHSKR
ncbi:hypothetical protein F5877DRAFT_87070, partial [Lentinula edodes]